MSFAFFTTVFSRAKPSGSTANKIKDTLTNPSAHCRTNSGTADVLLSSPLRRQPRAKRNVESQRHADYTVHPSVALAGSSTSAPIAPAQVSRSSDAKEAMYGLNGLMLKKFKKQFPEDGQIRVAPAHGSLVAIVRCGGPKGWSIEIKDPSELPKPTKRNVSSAPIPLLSPLPSPILSQEQLEVIEGLNRMLVKKYKKTLPENGQIIMVPAHGAVMARLRCGGPDGWAAQINPDLCLQVV